MIWKWTKCKCGHRAWNHPCVPKISQRICLSHTMKEGREGFIYHSQPWHDKRGYCPCNDFEPARKVKQ